MGKAERASVLFSGGSDSTLAAVKALEKHKTVDLLTYQPGFIFFIENSKYHSQRLIQKYGKERVSHYFENIKQEVKALLWSRFRQSLREFGPNMTSLICLGCRLAMHTRAIIHNLKNSIPYLYDGSISKQSLTECQGDEVKRRNASFYLEKFGIKYVSPVYETDDSDKILYKMGITEIKHLKRQFIFYDTQAFCPFGCSADVYAKLFYTPIFCGDRRDKDRLIYLDWAQPIMLSYITYYFKSRGEKLEKLVSLIRD